MIRRSIVVLAAALVASGSAFAGGDVSGKISWEGKVPGRKQLKMQADPVCASKYTVKVLSEAVLVNENNTLANVFVYVEKGLEGKTFDVPADPVVLDQKGCRFIPHVVVVPKQRPLRILNSDGILHNVHSHAKKNRPFNWAQPPALKQIDETFKRPERIRVSCDVHDWMGAWIIVACHPYYTLTG